MPCSFADTRATVPEEIACICIYDSFADDESCAKVCKYEFRRLACGIMYCTGCRVRDGAASTLICLELNAVEMT